MVTLRALKVLLGSVAVAGVFYAILAAPGFLSDGATTVLVQNRIAMVCP